MMGNMVLKEEQAVDEAYLNALKLMYDAFLSGIACGCLLGTDEGCIEANEGIMKWKLVPQVVKRVVEWQIP